jgi:hypothetical protein
MNNYSPKPGEGTLFVNSRKEKETHPDRSGFVHAHKDIKKGVRVNLAGWLAKTHDGKAVKDRNGKPILNLRMSDERK